jgi:hypothetical protein
MAIKISGTTVIDDSQGLRITGISTFTNGPVLVGSATSTGTASQPLQVTGGGYVSGNLGVGNTNPASNTQVAIAGTLGISEVGGAGTRTLISSSGNGFVLNHNDNSNINIQSQGSNRLAYQFSSNSWVIPATGTSLVIGTGSTTGTASQPLQVTGGGYFSSSVGIGSTNPTSTLSVGGTITELYAGQYWNLVSQADIGIGASQVPLNQYLGQLAFLDSYSPSGLRRDGGGADDVTVNSSGFVGVGTTNPTSLLTVQGGGLFTGIITARNAVTQDSISLNGRAGGTSSFNLSLTPTTLGASRTVTFQDVSGTVYVSGGTDVTLADGGTNASLTAVNGGVVYSTSSAMAITAAGSAGQVLTSNGAASPTWSTLNASPITVCCTSNFLSCNTSATNIDTKSPPSNNFFLGCNAGSSIYTGSSNIFLGPNAGTSNQSGSNNVFLGCNSGCLITGGCNVVIGGFTGTGFVSCTNHIFLSDGAGNNRAQFNGSGAFGLNGANYGTAGQVLTSNGTAGAPTWQAASGGLTLTDDTSTNATRYIPITSATSGSVSTVNVSSTKLQFNPSTGNLSATQFTSLSDVTQKTNIQPIENSIELTKQLQGVRFDWIDNNKPSLGLIAQEVEKVLPELVETSADGTKSVSYGNIVGVLIEAIKEQQVRIEELERKLKQ